MIYLELFLSFLKIGAVSFGGGYGMISLIRETVITNGWLSEEQFLSFIAVAESTPGPLAINMATFIGSAQGGFAGALAATAGVILPSFVIILIIAAAIKNILRFAGVRAVLDSVQPAICALITATAITMFITCAFSFTSVGDGFRVNVRILITFAIVALIALGYRFFRKKSFSPILLIIISGALGIIFNLILP